MRRKKTYENPFVHTNLITLCNSIDKTAKTYILGYKSREEKDRMNIIVNYPSYARKNDDEF